MAVRLPPRGTSVEELRCKKCGKKIKELKPGECADPECPYKKKVGS